MNLRIALAAAAVAFAPGCATRTEWAPINPTAISPLAGAWEDGATGHVVNFAEGRVDVFHRLDDVWIRDSGVVPPFALYAIARDGELLLQHYDYRAYPDLLQAPAMLERTTPPPSEAAEQSDAAAPGETFELIWRTFERYYPFFEQRGVDWAASRESFAPRAAAAANRGELFEIISEMLAPLGDGHVNVTLGDRTFNAGRSRLRTRLSQAWERSGSTLSEQAFVSAWSQAVRDSIYGVLDPGSLRTGAAGAIEWGTIGGDVGYLRVNRFTRFTEEDAQRQDQIAALRRALWEMDRDLAATNRMIVDVALNGGGNDAAAMAVAAHFADRRRLVLEYRAVGAPDHRIFLAPPNAPYRRPVLLLTSEVTASAAESFVLMMRSYPHVRHVGERTRGILSSLLPKPIPGGFLVTLPYQHVLDAEGRIYEAVGIPPTRQIELFPDDDLAGGFARVLQALARDDDPA